MTTRLAVLAIVVAVLGFAGQSPAQQSPGDIISPSAASQGQPSFSGPAASPQPESGQGPCDCRPGACCIPNWSVYSELLYLRPGNANIPFGVPINGAIAPPAGVAPVQVGPEGVVDHYYQPAFRLGFRCALDDCGSLGGSYTQFDHNAAAGLHVTAPTVIQSLITHPGTFSAATDFLDSDANDNLQFRLADIDYRRTLCCDDLYAINYLFGCRYASLNQNFLGQFSNSTTHEAVATQVNFEGGGLRVGLDGERHACGSGWMVYGKGDASFVGGQLRTQYTQQDDFRGTVVSTGWNEQRVITILNLELGFGWVSPSGRFRATTGYMVNGWLNMLRTSDYINAVQTNTSGVSTNQANMMTFDGLVTRLEYRF